MTQKQVNSECTNLFRGRGVLGNSLGTLRHSMLGEFTRQDQADRGLNFSGRDSGLLVVGSQLGRLGGDTLENVYRVLDRSIDTLELLL